MIKLVVGILKGAVIGGAVGYGAYALKTAIGFDNPWFTYGIVGALVGFIAGRSLWSLIRDKNATAWVAILKAAFGFGVGCGLYALLAKVWAPSCQLMIAGENAFTWPVTVGAAIGAVWGGFVELDDAIGDDGKKDKKSSDKGADKTDGKLAAKPAGKPAPKR